MELESIVDANGIFCKSFIFELIFVEAKGLWDDRLFPKNKNKPEIIDQMSRYEAILKNHKK